MCNTYVAKYKPQVCKCSSRSSSKFLRTLRCMKCVGHAGKYVKMSISKQDNKVNFGHSLPCKMGMEALQVR